MARNRGFKEPIPKILVICEGSETETPYFKDMQQFAIANGHTFDMKILPGSEDDFSDSDRAAMKKEREQYKSNPSSYSGTLRWPYYAKYETDEATYKKYSAQPTRYVREAQLYLKEGAYTEAWVVYDYDVKSGKYKDKDHQGAYELGKTDKRIHIAFSSYSFEEWLLLHFERNKKAFGDSMCDEYKHSLKQHKKKSSVQVTCSCGNCLAGYMNEMGYIPNYGKSGSGYFKEFTLDENLKLRKKALINAAWSRSLDNRPFYERNPYTDVDLFILKMFGQETKIEWVKTNEKFELGGNEMVVLKNGRGVSLSMSDFSANLVISSDNVYWCNDEYRMILPACPGNNFVFTSKMDLALVNKPEGEAVLCIKDDFREIYIEVCDL